MQKTWFLSSLFAGVFLTGCGNSLPSNPKTYPVHGQVLTADGQPVRWAVVYFEPDGSGVACMGRITEDGHFNMGTANLHQDPDGAVPGKYKVYLEPFSEDLFAKPRKDVNPTPIPSQYLGARTSGWTVEVKAGENEVGPFRFDQ